MKRSDYISTYNPSPYKLLISSALIIEHRYRGIDNKWHPILARGVPVRDEKDKIINWVGINLDISRIKQAEGS